MDLEPTKGTPEENVTGTIAKPVYIRDISPERGWPTHLESLLGSLQTPITLHHVATGLAFVLCVEVGFVPETEGQIGLEPTVILQMSEEERLTRFASSFPDTTTVQNYYAFGLRSIKHRVNVELEEGTNGDGPKTLGQKEELPTTSSHQGSKMEDESQVGETAEAEAVPDEVLDESQSGSSNSGFEYYFSPLIKLIVEIRANQVFVTGIPEVQGAGENTHFQFTLNQYLHNDLRKEISGESYVQSTSEWMADISIDGRKLSHEFKTTVGLPLIDSVDGLTREFRGLQSLPKEVVVNILNMVSAKTLANVSAVSLYMNEVASIPVLWRRHLVKDFGHLHLPFRGDLDVLSAQKFPRVYNIDYKAAYQRLARATHTREERLLQLGVSSDEDDDDDEGEMHFLDVIPDDPWFL